ncbi:unnamed protein product [Thelazia callipaeda]|uniref:Uncharacterized protein n=1 Tax=Thelazia callipaeda TaxID=103827 RepID=A0A0N5D825_THECL|nr:unnamed protein product [Thelazia callipaeda]
MLKTVDVRTGLQLQPKFYYYYSKRKESRLDRRLLLTTAVNGDRFRIKENAIGCVGNQGRLIGKEESDRWVRAPPNCNPFDMRASFTCSSMSSKAAVPQATYGRSRLNTATGIERPASNAVPLMTVRNGTAVYRPSSWKREQQTGSINNLFSDCRRHEDGCFSSHLRWQSVKDCSDNLCSQSSSRPVVYVPVNLFRKSNHFNVASDVKVHNDNVGGNNKCSSSPSLQPAAVTPNFSSPSTPINRIDTVISKNSPVNSTDHKTDFVTSWLPGRKIDDPEQGIKEEVSEELEDELVTSHSSQCNTLCLLSGSDHWGVTISSSNK